MFNCSTNVVTAPYQRRVAQQSHATQTAIVKNNTGVSMFVKRDYSYEVIVHVAFGQKGAQGL